MAFCKNCGTPMTENEAFCKNCGAPVAKSTWDGGVLDTFLNSIVASLLITFTCGIGTPWAVCYMMKFVISHAIKTQTSKRGFEIKSQTFLIFSFI